MELRDGSCNFRVAGSGTECRVLCRVLEQDGRRRGRRDASVKNLVQASDLVAKASNPHAEQDLTCLKKRPKDRKDPLSLPAMISRSSQLELPG